MPINNSYFNKRDFKKGHEGDVVKLVKSTRNSSAVKKHIDCLGVKTIVRYSKTPAVSKLTYTILCGKCDEEFNVSSQSFEVLIENVFPS